MSYIYVTKTHNHNYSAAAKAITGTARSPYNNQKSLWHGVYGISVMVTKTLLGTVIAYNFVKPMQQVKTPPFKL